MNSPKRTVYLTKRETIEMELHNYEITEYYVTLSFNTTPYTVKHFIFARLKFREFTVFEIPEHLIFANS